MTGLILEISSEFTVKSSVRLSTKNAWALYARRRWPANGVKSAMTEWGLTEGEAKGLFAATISQNTIDKIIDHRRGGFALGLLILQVRTQTGLRDYLREQGASADDEIASQQARKRELEELGRHIPPAPAERARFDRRAS